MKRVVWIDWSKAILIYLMAVGHCGVNEASFVFIYSFHMPAFYIISGFLYKEYDWQSTTRQFLIPILFFSLINGTYFIAIELLHNTFDPYSFIQKVYLPYLTSVTDTTPIVLLFPGFWFIFVLYICRLLMGDVRIFNPIKKYAPYIIITISIYMWIEPHLAISNQIKSMHLYKVIPCFPFILIGYMLKKYPRIIRLPKFILLFIIFIFPILITLNGHCDIYQHAFGQQYFIFLINAVVGSIILFNLCSYLPHIKIATIFSCGTFLILASHLILRNRIDECISYTGLIFENNHFYPWSLVFILFIIYYYPILFLLRTFPILLGKKRKFIT